MNNTFDLVDFSKYNSDDNNNNKIQRDKIDYSECFEIDIQSLLEEENDELYYRNLHHCKDIIGENMDKIVKEFPQVNDGLNPHNNSFTKSLIDDGSSVSEAYAMGFLFMLMIMTNLSKY